MLCVIPVCEKDAHLSVRSLEHSLTLDGKVDFSAWVCHERGFDASTVVDAAREYFASVRVFVYDKWTGDSSWPHGANYAWQTVARAIESAKVKMPWLWLEPDAIPIKPGWLHALKAAYENGGRPFAGAVTTQMGQVYIAGVAIYPPNISNHCMSALLTRTQPFDIIASTRDGILRKAHDISPLIQHTPLTNNTHFATMDDVAREIPETAVLFHKCKDGSLLDVLQGKVGPSEPNATNSPAVITNVPSFTQQTDWPAGYFTFPAATNTVYFNPSLIEYQGRMHLLTRRFRYRLEQVTSGMMEGNQSDLAIWTVRDNMTVESSPLIPTMPMRYPKEQWEDPRAMVGPDGRIYLGMATWVHHKDWAIRQSFARLSPDWRKVEPLWESAYGGNSPRPVPAGNARQNSYAGDGKQFFSTTVGHEKNWIWFWHDNAWHCQYSINPGDVFRVDALGNPVDSWKTKEARIDWQHGLPLRGGTQPTRVGDEYIAFFHTSVTWQKPKRRYFMGAYTFDAEPPFALRKITANPLLTGSEHDFRALGGPLVIFPNGAVFRDGEWTVVFGVNDEACGWVKIPHQELMDQMVDVRRSVMEKLSMAFA